MGNIFSGDPAMTPITSPRSTVTDIDDEDDWPDKEWTTNRLSVYSPPTSREYGGRRKVRGSFEEDLREEKDEDVEDIFSKFQENIKFALLWDPPHPEVDAWPDTINRDFLFIEREMGEMMDTIGIFSNSDTSKTWLDSPHPPRKLHNRTWIL
jgi:hypothetical protein